MGEPADEALLAGLAAGDPDSAARLVRRHQARVFGVAVAILGDRGRAEDVAQEAFVRAWRHADAFDARRGTFAAWILTITRNLAFDVLRAERIRPTAPLDGFLAELAQAPDVPPDDQAVRSAEVDAVRRALRQLPEGQRRAVVLASYGGRTAREVGEIDGIPLGTAKTRIRDGLHQLRRELGLRPEGAT